jgi:hypothetical protein
MKALITLTDVECAVRLNASLEQAGVETVMVSPLDDIRRETSRRKRRARSSSAMQMESLNTFARSRSTVFREQRCRAAWPAFADPRW